MTRLILPVLGALLAFVSSVDAKSKKDRIELYQFANGACLDSPIGADVELELLDCVKLGNHAQSFRPMLDPKRQKWLDRVNRGDLECFLALFNDTRCAGNYQGYFTLPNRLQACLTPESTTDPVGSAKFFCRVKSPLSEELESSTVSTITSTTVATSWSVGSDNIATPIIDTETIKVTTTSVLPPDVAGHVEPRTVQKGEEANVWMQHPWSGSFICYHCHTKNKGRYDWVKCKGGPSVHPADCGASPVNSQGVVITNTTTVPGTTATETLVTDGTLTTTTTSISLATTTPPSETVVSVEVTTVITSLSTSTSSASIAQGAPLEVRKSWHKRVAFKNPWTPDRMCADAEWEKRGKPNWEIRLQDVKFDKGGDCAGVLELDAPSPVIMTSHTTTTLTGFTNFVTVTETVTSMVGPDPTTTVFPSVVVAQLEDDSIPHRDL